MASTFGSLPLEEETATTSSIHSFLAMPHSMLYLSSPTKDWTNTPASEAWGFNQWTTKGAPMFSILDFTWFRPFILEMRKGLAQDHSPTWLIRPGLLITHLVEQKLFPLQHPQMIPKISFWSPGRVSQECSTNFFVKAPYQMKDNCRKLSPSAGNMP